MLIIKFLSLLLLLSWIPIRFIFVRVIQWQLGLYCYSDVMLFNQWEHSFDKEAMLPLAKRLTTLSC